MFNQVTAIGLGGIFSYLWDGVCRRMLFLPDAPKSIDLVDGDEVAHSNFDRQSFGDKDVNRLKAEVYADRIKERAEFASIAVTVTKDFVTRKNASKIIKDKSIVLSCVDNHAARLLISEHARKKSDIIVISAGNNLHDGSVHLYLVFDGVEITERLEKIHPEVAMPRDRNPGDLSCEERAALPGGGQVAEANFGAAYNAFVYFSRVLECLPRGKEAVEEELKKVSEVFFDTKKLNSLSYARVARKPRNLVKSKK